MLTTGERISPEIVFAFRMLMLKYHLNHSDIMKLLVTIDKENAPHSGGH